MENDVNVTTQTCCAAEMMIPKDEGDVDGLEEKDDCGDNQENYLTVDVCDFGSHGPFCR